MTDKTHPVDEMLAPPKLFTLGLQHVLVMYAGAVAVPLIVGRALKLLSYSPTLGQILGLFKLLPSSADRFQCC
jgi:xanthine/uracil permease